MDAVRAPDEPVADLVGGGFRRGDPLAAALAPGLGVGLSVAGRRWAVATADPVPLLAELTSRLHPRWVWWSADTPAPLVAAGLRVPACWDVAAVHRLLFGGWAAEPARVWAALHELDQGGIPALGQLDLLAEAGDDGGDPSDPVRADGHLRPEWAGGGWARSRDRLARWAETALTAATLQRARLAGLGASGDALGTARSESAAELLCTELAADGLPVDRIRAEEIITAAAGPRDDPAASRAARDEEVLRHLPGGERVDLRNPARVKEALVRVGIDVPDTRSWRLEPLAPAHPFVRELLRWRKAERIATTYGYGWLDIHVGPDDRLRGRWTGSDGAAGRMTAQAGLHNLPAELRPAIAGMPGHLLVRADLGQIEPRILAAVSGDPALVAATGDDDLYAPVAARLGVPRPTAKVAVLAAMYGQTSGAAGAALRGMEAAYPVAMRYLRTAEEAGQAARPVRTYGGRLVRMGEPTEAAGVRAARGRFARNAMVQGAAAEFFKAWAVTVRARLAAGPARIVLCLHDELLVHAPEADADRVARLLRDCLVETGRRWAPDGPGAAVRFVADVAAVRRWSEAKP